MSATGIALCETVIGGSVGPFYLPHTARGAIAANSRRDRALTMVNGTSLLSFTRHNLRKQKPRVSLHTSCCW